MRAIDLTGQKFNRLTAIRRDPKRPLNWFFQCDCGTIKSQQAGNVKSGAVKSCGCLFREMLDERVAVGYANGENKHPLFDLWAGMIARCENPNHKGFHNYGGKGVKVCSRWKDFMTFVKDVGDRPEGTSLDRIRSEGDYEPGNWRWATPKEQSLNTKRNVYLELSGVRLTVSEWSEKLGIDQRTLNRRRQLGWSDEQILTIPIRGKR